MLFYADDNVPYSFAPTLTAVLSIGRHVTFVFTLFARKLISIFKHWMVLTVKECSLLVFLDEKKICFKPHVDKLSKRLRRILWFFSLCTFFLFNTSEHIILKFTKEWGYSEKAAFAYKGLI